MTTKVINFTCTIVSLTNYTHSETVPSTQRVQTKQKLTFYRIAVKYEIRFIRIMKVPALQLALLVRSFMKFLFLFEYTSC